MSKTAEKFVSEAIKWNGVKEGSSKHIELIEIYNSHKPLAHGYLMGETDSWCAMFVSAISIICGYTDIIPTDIRCSSFIDKFKKLGVWKEDENRTPNVGDICFYDWEDSGSGNNKGTPNHVGIVTKVNGSKFEVIEGNKDNRVAVRSMKVNGKYLRGFAVPKYTSETLATDSEPSYYIHTVQKGDRLWTLARKYLGKGTRYKEIMKANSMKTTIIRAGMKLKIPEK